jgi:hypothetical protein
MLEPAVRRSNGRFTMDNVRNEVQTGELVLWLVFRDRAPTAFYTTRISEYPNRRAMVVDWLGGRDMDDWLDAAIDEMKAHAVVNHCKHLEFCGRVGWKKVLALRGWKSEYVAYRMELTDE